MADFNFGFAAPRREYVGLPKGALSAFTGIVDTRYQEGEDIVESAKDVFGSYEPWLEDVGLRNSLSEELNAELDNLINNYEGAYESSRFQRDARTIINNFKKRPELAAMEETRKIMDAERERAIQLGPEGYYNFREPGKSRTYRDETGQWRPAQLGIEEKLDFTKRAQELIGQINPDGNTTILPTSHIFKNLVDLSGDDFTSYGLTTTMTEEISDPKLRSIAEGLVNSFANTKEGNQELRRFMYENTGSTELYDTLEDGTKVLKEAARKHAAETLIAVGAPQVFKNRRQNYSELINSQELAAAKAATGEETTSLGGPVSQLPNIKSTLTVPEKLDGMVWRTRTDRRPPMSLNMEDPNYRSDDETKTYTGIDENISPREIVQYHQFMDNILPSLNIPNYDEYLTNFGNNLFTTGLNTKPLSKEEYYGQPRLVELAKEVVKENAHIYGTAYVREYDIENNSADRIAQENASKRFRMNPAGRSVAKINDDGSITLLTDKEARELPTDKANIIGEAIPESFLTSNLKEQGIDPNVAERLSSGYYTTVQDETGKVIGNYLVAHSEDVINSPKFQIDRLRANLYQDTSRSPGKAVPINATFAVTPEGYNYHVVRGLDPNTRRLADTWTLRVSIPQGDGTSRLVTVTTRDGRMPQFSSIEQVINTLNSELKNSLIIAPR